MSNRKHPDEYTLNQIVRQLFSKSSDGNITSNDEKEMLETLFQWLFDPDTYGLRAWHKGKSNEGMNGYVLFRSLNIDEHSKSIEISRSDFFAFLEYEPSFSWRVAGEQNRKKHPNEIKEEEELKELESGPVAFKEKIKNLYMVNSFWGPLGGMENEEEPRQSKSTIPTETISDDEQAEAFVFVETNKEYLPKRFSLHYIAQLLCGENPSDSIASDCAYKTKYQLMSHIEKRELSAWHNDRKIPPKGDFGRDDGVVGPKRTVPGGISYFRQSLETILPEPYSEWQEFIMDKADDILINRNDFLELIFKEQGVLLKLYNQRISTLEAVKQPVELDKVEGVDDRRTKKKAKTEARNKVIQVRAEKIYQENSALTNKEIANEVHEQLTKEKIINLESNSVYRRIDFSFR